MVKENFGNDLEEHRIRGGEKRKRGNQMKQIRGIAASRGVAIGKLVLEKAPVPHVEKKKAENSAAELARFEQALEKAQKELSQLYLVAVEQVGKECSMIFQLHEMMLEDPDFLESVTGKILREQVCAEYAVWKAGKELSTVFSSLEDQYMRGRAADVQDICLRLLCSLDPEGFLCHARTVGEGEPCILALPQLLPSRIMRLREDGISGVITGSGSRRSHSAILARILGIPAVVSTGPSFSALQEGETVVLDGSTGWICADPDQETLRRYRRRQKLAGEPSAALGNEQSPLRLLATAAAPENAQEALEDGAEGIGLYRSELLCLSTGEMPQEEEQFLAYKAILEHMKGKPVTIRTMDISGEINLPYLGVMEEENPAMGYRAIRFSLNHPELFRVQLRALLRASVYGELRILLPMVTTEQEVLQAKEQLQQVRRELEAEKIPFHSAVPLGVMIETPAAALIAGTLARQVDFFSIGTSDLTQFATGADRANLRVAYLHDCHHPAVLQLIRAAAQAAAEAGIPVSICGEAASDVSLLGFFLECGVSSLTVPPANLGEIRSALQALQNFGDPQPLEEEEK